MKRGLLFVFLFVSCLSLAFASYQVHNVSIKKSYPLNQELEGRLNITIEGMKTDSVITSNLGHEALMIDLLKDNAALFECSPYDCESGYKVLNKSQNLSVFLGSWESRVFGVFVNGSDVSFKDFDIELSSDFGSEDRVPLQIRFFDDEDYQWSYDEFSSSDFREKNYGSYDDGDKVAVDKLSSVSYCSGVYVHETDLLWVGADIDVDNSSGEIEVSLYNDVGGFVASGEYDPSEDESFDGVRFDAEPGSLFGPGDYYVCIKAKDPEAEEYGFYRDKNGTVHSGFSFLGETFNSSAAGKNHSESYAIYIQEALYASAESLDSVNLTSHFLGGVDEYIDQKYNGDCSDGCYLPFKVISGVKQNLEMKNLYVDYISDYKGFDDDIIYSLEKTPARVDFSGVLDFSVLDFVMNESEHLEIFIEGDEIVEGDINITPAPLIDGIFPRRVPAGLQSSFIVDVVYDGDNSTLSYEWDFGDGTSATSEENKVYHQYGNISEYVVKVNVSDGQYSNSYETTIETVNPREYVHVVYRSLSSVFNQSIESISTFPAWQESRLKNILEIEDVRANLSHVSRKIKNAYDDEDYLEIASILGGYVIPREVFVSEDFEYSDPLVEDVNLEALNEYLGDSFADGTREEYVDALFRFNDEYLNYSVSRKKISYISSAGDVEDVMLVYSVNLYNDFREPVYLVIEAPRDELTFSGLDKEPRSKSGVTIVEVDGKSEKHLDFYVLGFEGVDFFASPEMKYLQLEPEINPNCNFNYECEEGEDYKTCRSDCKPVWHMIVYIILGFIFCLGLYTLIQVWYLKYYENYLFKDKNRLHNLLMFVTSARSKGMSREQIKKALRQKGWTSERIDFVVRRAEGDRIGLYEIIPVSKFLASSRKKEVKESPSGSFDEAPSPHRPVGRVGHPPGHHNKPIDRGSPKRFPSMRHRGHSSHPKGPGYSNDPSKDLNHKSGGGSGNTQADKNATRDEQQKGGNINKGSFQRSDEARK